ncbi:ABC transporter ATP-binding protein [Marinomonas sp. PE14-40]|uniref:ABC transporter ATP-binding protein n=1 Tax=Marinomonas sp. PE14-40 TaxID=3060621 RepID=UPI003F67C8E7
MSKFSWLGAFTHFLPFIKAYRKDYILGLLPVPISVFCNIAFPWLIIQIIDQQLVVKHWEGMSYWIRLIVLVLICNYLSSSFYNYFVQKAALQTITDIRKDLFNRVLHFPKSFYDKTPMGSVLTRITSDLEAITESLASGVLAMVKDVLVTIALFIFLATISWKLTLLTLVIAPPMYWITSRLRRSLQKSQLGSRRILSKSTGYLQESLQGIKTVQLYNAEHESQNKYQDFTKVFFKHQSKSNLIDASLFSIIEGITTISMGLIIWYGANEILLTTLSVGVLIGFIQTLDKIFVPIRDFTSQIASIQRAIAALNNIEGLYLQETEIAGNSKTYDKHKFNANQFESLIFNQVYFRYKQDMPYVLNGVSFELNQGEKIALVGSTGSGKSTIIRLLTKVYVGYEGSIKLNGVELKDIDKNQLMNFYSLMQQEVYLFNESIEFNISLARQHIDQTKVKQAAEYVFADSFIQSLPGDYQFQITDNGGNLSAGQGQLIAFARAMATQSYLVLLDEATSSIDLVTEQMIQKAIEQVFKEKTLIAIAHRLSTIQNSDQILVLEKGRVVEIGDHKALVQMDGIYANLVNAEKK